MGFLVLVLGAWLLGGCGGGGGGGGASGGGCDPACGSDQFCDYAYDWCGPPPEAGDDIHECASRDTECDADTPACGCDGKVYDSECAAHQAGIDIGDKGTSAGNGICGDDLTPQGRFSCGPWYCEAATSYCLYRQGDTGDRQVACKPLPDACAGTGSCDCVPILSGAGYSDCTPVEGNGVTGIQVYEALQ